MLANMFFHSAAMDFAISVLGVLIFTGLTAWDTQNIKNMYYGASGGRFGSYGGAGVSEGNLAIIGALRLYLDFINLFMFLLRFMGNSRR
jgi:FtsH-binding integral membrane protein